MPIIDPYEDEIEDIRLEESPTVEQDTVEEPDIDEEAVPDGIVDPYEPEDLEAWREKDWANMTPEERERALASEGDDVPDIDHIEATRQDSMDEYRTKVEAQRTWYENFLDHAEKEIYPTLGAVLGALRVGKAGSLLARGLGRVGQSIAGLFAGSLGAGVGGAAGESANMANEYMRGDSDAPETFGEATGRAGRVGVREALWEFGGVIGLRSLGLLYKVTLGGFESGLGFAERQLARFSFFDETFKAMDKKKYESIKAANDALTGKLAEDTITTLSPEGVGDILRGVARGDGYVSNHILKFHMHELDSMPGLTGRFGPPGAEKIGPNAINMSHVQTSAHNRLASYSDPNSLHRPASRELAANVLQQLDEIGEVTGFAGAFAAQTELLEVAKRAALDIGDEKLARHFTFIQNSLKREMDDTAARIGGETEAYYKNLMGTPDETMREINERFMVDIAVNNPRLVGTQIGALSPKESLNFKRTLYTNLSKEEADRVWNEIGHGYLTEVIGKMVDPETGKVSAEAYKELISDPRNRALVKQLYGEEVTQRFDIIMDLMESQVRKPGSYILDAGLTFDYFAKISGLGGLIGAVGKGLAGLDPTGIAGSAAVGSVAAASIPGLAALARQTGASAEVVSRWVHEIMAMVMTDPKHAKLMADALRFGPDHPKAATIMAQLNAAILEATDVIAFREAKSFEEAVGLQTGDVDETGVSPEGEGATDDTLGLPPGARLLKDRESTPTTPEPGENPYNVPPGATLLKEPSIPREEEKPLPKFEASNEEEWIRSYQEANPGATRTQAIKAGRNSGALPKDYKDQPRGIRNNNPGNIRISDTNWEGKVEGHDSSFETFETPEHGIRAMVVNLRSYQTKYNLNTINQIISRWAPPNENATGSYIDTVAKRMGVQPNERLNLNDPKVMRELIKAIIYVENGSNPYDDKLVDKGIRMASK